MYGIHQEKITELRENPFIRNILTPEGTIATWDESSIIRGHFGIVPGVITEKIATILANIGPHECIETQYKQALRPGNRIAFQKGKDESKIYIPGEKNIEILCTSEASGEIHTTYDFPKNYQGKDLDHTTLWHHLLQSGDFRLATSASTIDKEGQFSGHYIVPDKYPFLISDTLPFSLMKEVANQIIALSYSLTSNIKGVNQGTTILLANSHVTGEHPNSIKILIGSRITVTGRIKQDPINPRRGIIAEYTAYNGSSLLFHGKISGTKVPTKILTK